jgi:hypothetical protein
LKTSANLPIATSHLKAEKRPVPSLSVVVVVSVASQNLVSSQSRLQSKRREHHHTRQNTSRTFIFPNRINPLHITVKMARTGIVHHIGTFLLFAASILLLITTISAPVINDIGILKVKLTNGTAGHQSVVTFGTFGYCILDAGYVYLVSQWRIQRANQ